MNLVSKLRNILFAGTLAVSAAVLPTGQAQALETRIEDTIEPSGRIMLPERVDRTTPLIDIYRQPELEFDKSGFDVELEIFYDGRVRDQENAGPMLGFVQEIVDGGAIQFMDVVDQLASVQELSDEAKEIAPYGAQHSGAGILIRTQEGSYFSLSGGVDYSAFIYANIPSEETADLDDAPISHRGFIIDDENFFEQIQYLAALANFYMDDAPTRKVFDMVTTRDKWVKVAAGHQFSLPKNVKLAFYGEIEGKKRDVWDQEFTLPEMETMLEAMDLEFEPMGHIRSYLFNISAGSSLYLPEVYSRPMAFVDFRDVLSTKMKDVTRTLLQDPAMFEIGARFSPIDFSEGNLKNLDLGFALRVPMDTRFVEEDARFYGEIQYFPVEYIGINAHFAASNVVKEGGVTLMFNSPPIEGFYIGGNIEFGTENIVVPWSGTELENNRFLFSISAKYAGNKRGMGPFYEPIEPLKKHKK